MFHALKRRSRPRRGVTLVEMLVVVALVVLMMVILVQIFQSALGAMSFSRTTQELDVVLRTIDSTIRSDLNGVTAKMTPPNDPALKQGYFEYGENAPADLQGEDVDDFIAFTTKAPEGQVFTGRQWLSQFIGSVQTINQKVQPTTISSQVAEIIYFVRNGNLYRRVFLVVPDRKNSLTTSGTSTIGTNLPLGIYQTPMFGTSLNVSWQGMNDISCRPGGFSAPSGTGSVALPPIPNDLGNLTNRENRAFRPRFLNDFTGPNNTPDGIPDDNNADGVPDYYPTLYYNGVGVSQVVNNINIGWAPNGAVHESVAYPNSSPRVQPTTGIYDIYAFPFIYPGMYSVPDPTRLSNGLGWVHYLPPNSTSGYINHSPLDLGETPNFAPGTLPTIAANNLQTWWGFPTWRETMTGLVPNVTVGWRDPIYFTSFPTNQQPLGLRPFPPAVTPALNSTNFLPPVSSYGTSYPPYGFDSAGSNTFIANPTAPTTLWEDELILTNVRSFDVKAYDPDAPLYSLTSGNAFSAGYQDLGYGGLNYNTTIPGYLAPNFLAASTIYGPNGQNATTQTDVPFQKSGFDPVGFGHEGRIPPLYSDFRPHPRRGFNIGDPYPNANNPASGIIRLTHTFDTWSTDYVNAPDSDILLNGYFATSPPIYPSFPAPYTSPLRGIQIQIRVTDPRNERTKVLTIRHDFTDKL